MMEVAEIYQLVKRTNEEKEIVRRESSQFRATIGKASDL